MLRQPVSSNGLMVIVAGYFALLLGTIIGVGLIFPDILPFMPLGGNDALEIVGAESEELTAIDRFDVAPKSVLVPTTAGEVILLSLLVCSTLGGTILVMLPVTWTYIAIKREIGYRKSFARALLVLPICAATTVLLIQNNLALAFGLAAMVAAVRFRVTLNEAIDGIFIFASICVGLAAGIGYLGIATVMALVFCMTNAVLWRLDYGRNPIDEMKIATKYAQLKVDENSSRVEERTSKS